MKLTDSKNPTLQDIAQRVGVSITTVSHVLNKTRHVNKETKEAVLKVVRELNYQSLKNRKNGYDKHIFIGVMLADAREDYYIEMIKALESVAADFGVSIIFCDSEVDPEKEEKNIAFLLDRDVSGILIAPVEADNVPDILRKIDIPVVLIDRQFNSHNFLFVGINNFQSGYLGTEYLINKGCENIGFIGYSGPVYTIKQRTLGYSAYLLEFKPSAVPKVLSLSYNREDSFPLIKDFILKEQLDGLICVTSSACYEAIDVLEHLDAKIQKKLKILSYDDNRWLDFLKYPVSVISQPVAEIGYAALNNILQMIEEPSADRNLKRELLFDVSIIDRISQRPPA
jgi:LacI family transcriptional regulator